MKYLKRYNILIAIGLSMLISVDAGILLMYLAGILPSFTIIVVVLLSIGIFLTARGILPFLEEIDHIIKQKS